jgi:hypothetical protein
MKIARISRWRKELPRVGIERTIPMQVVGSYPCSDSAGCIPAIIWLPESAIPALQLNLEDQRLVNCACELVTERGAQF